MPYRRFLPIIAVLVLVVSACAGTTGTPGSPGQPPAPSGNAASTVPSGSGATPIRVVAGDTVLKGQLWDNATSRSLIAMLPLTVSMKDHNGSEKNSPLPQPLSMDGMPAGDDPRPQDIGYYAPAGDIVFYYGEVGYWNGIARIGEFTSSLDAISDRADGFSVTIELDG